MQHAKSLHGVRALALALVAAAALAASAGAQSGDAALEGVVNVNTASVAELELLPGIGSSRAQALVAERKRRGGFQSLEELTEVKGIGAASLERLKPYVRLDGKTTARPR